MFLQGTGEESSPPPQVPLASQQVFDNKTSTQKIQILYWQRPETNRVKGAGANCMVPPRSRLEARSPVPQSWWDSGTCGLKGTPAGGMILEARFCPASLEE